MEREIDHVLSFIPDYQTREYIQAPIDFNFDLIEILQNDPATWAFEIVLVLSLTIVPVIMIILVGFIC